MHPMTTHHLAMDNQRRLLDQANADRLARQATAGRPSFVGQMIAAIRVRLPRTAVRSAARSAAPHGARTGQA